MIILRQKDFAIKVKDNKFTRKVFTPLENLREGLLKRAENKQRDYNNKSLSSQHAAKAADTLIGKKNSRNKKLSRTVKDLAYKNNNDLTIIRNNPNSGKSNEFISKGGQGKGVANKLLPSKNVIDVTGNYSPTTLAHEVGHYQNTKSKNPITKLVSNLDTRSRKNIVKSNSPVKRALSSLIINREEKNATKKGLKLLKKAGATKEELKNAKIQLNAAGDTYKYGTKANVYGSVAEKLEKPWIQFGNQSTETDTSIMRSMKDSIWKDLKKKHPELKIK